MNLKNQRPLLSVKINDAKYKANMKKAKIYCRQVITAIKSFAPDDVTSVLDQDDFQENLQRVKDKFLQVTAWVDALIVELEENNEDARIAELEAMITGVKEVMDHNQRAVKRKMEKVIADDLAAQLPTPAEEKAIRMQEEKIKIRKTFIEEKCRNLYSVIGSLKKNE